MIAMAGESNALSPCKSWPFRSLMKTGNRAGVADLSAQEVMHVLFIMLLSPHMSLALLYLQALHSTHCLVYNIIKNKTKHCLYFWWHTSRCVDILELSELDDLLTFHHHTLLLYCSLCALGNTRVCHALCSHVDQSQVLHAIQNPHLPGPLRSAFYKLLIQVVAYSGDCLSEFMQTLVFGEVINLYFCLLGSPQQPHHSMSHDEPWIHCSYDWPDQRNHPLS